MRDQRADVTLGIAPRERFEDDPIEPRSFRIAVLGDFGGRGDAASRHDAPRRVDRDDLDAHLARVAPRLRVSIDGSDIDLAFASMDDFHPDALVARLESLGTTAGPATPAPDTSRPATSPPTREAADVARVVSSGSLLDDMLDDATGAGAADIATRPRDELAAFVDRAVTPHLVTPPDAREVESERTRHDRLVQVLRGVLHHPRVQSLEATWRSLELLVRRLDTDGMLHLFLVDVTRDAIPTAIQRLAAEREVGDGVTWGLAIALHAFPDTDAGVEALAQVAIAARAAAIPCVLAAPAVVTGRPSAAALDDDDTEPSAPPEVYSLIRRSIEARSLGLTFPRVLLREPYGRENPCETIAFEELADPERHDAYLWGSGAAIVALLVGEAFNAQGWNMAGRIPLDVGGLPYYTFRRGPNVVATSCAESVMSERGARHLLSRGLMPIAWIRDTDRVRLVELRSVADPSAPLAAPWLERR